MSSQERIRVLDLMRNVVARNDEIASSLRARFSAGGLFVLNLLSGPGAGKTTLLERSLRILRGQVSCLVVEGDLRTDRDARRIAEAGGAAVQIVTNGTCHLDSRMIQSAIEEVDLTRYDALVIENVGNLVCPSSFDLGESARSVIASVPEGEDKPEKYPFMFERAHAVVLNKMDLLPYTTFDRDAFWAGVGRINPSAERFEVSCTTGVGVDAWIEWFRRGIRASPRSRSPNNA